VSADEALSQPRRLMHGSGRKPHSPEAAGAKKGSGCCFQTQSCLREHGSSTCEPKEHRWELAENKQEAALHQALTSAGCSTAAHGEPSPGAHGERYPEAHGKPYPEACLHASSVYPAQQRRPLGPLTMYCVGSREARLHLLRLRPLLAGLIGSLDQRAAGEQVPALVPMCVSDAEAVRPACLAAHAHCLRTRHTRSPCPSRPSQQRSPGARPGASVQEGPAARGNCTATITAHNPAEIVPTWSRASVPVQHWPASLRPSCLHRQLPSPGMHARRALISFITPNWRMFST
jgi:hypothetical protein